MQRWNPGSDKRSFRQARQHGHICLLDKVEGWRCACTYLLDVESEHARWACFTDPQCRADTPLPLSIGTWYNTSPSARLSSLAATVDHDLGSVSGGMALWSRAQLLVRAVCVVGADARSFAMLFALGLATTSRQRAWRTCSALRRPALFAFSHAPGCALLLLAGSTCFQILSSVVD